MPTNTSTVPTASATAKPASSPTSTIPVPSCATAKHQGAIIAAEAPPYKAVPEGTPPPPKTYSSIPPYKALPVPKTSSIATAGTATDLPVSVSKAKDGSKYLPSPKSSASGPASQPTMHSVVSPPPLAPSVSPHSPSGSGGTPTPLNPLPANAGPVRDNAARQGPLVPVCGFQKPQDYPPTEPPWRSKPGAVPAPRAEQGPQPKAEQTPLPKPKELAPVNAAL